MTMTMPMKAATRPAKADGRKRRYTPLPDPPKKVDMIHNIIQNAIQTMLINHYGNDPTTLVGTNGYLLRTAGDFNGHPVPDCIVAFGVEAVRLMKEANGYIVDEVGKPPDLVLEIASESTGVRDYTVKRRMYQDLDVPEYWRFDYTGGRYHDAPLAGDILVDGEYRRIRIDAEPDGTFWGYSPALGLYLVWQEEDLRFYDPSTGQFLPDPHEYANERNAAVRASEEDRAARIESDRRAEAERAARAEADRRAAAERAARIEAEAELERLRRLLGDS